MTREKEQAFDAMYDLLYLDYKVGGTMILHYFNVFIVRRMAFIIVAYYFSQAKYTVF